MRTPLLEVTDLTMQFGGLTAVDSVSFTAHQGEITAIIGPNGAGKTTLFNCLTGFYKPTHGTLLLHTAEKSIRLDTLPRSHIAAKAKIARTFQNIRLFTGMTVLENLLVAQHNALMQASGFCIAGLLGLPRYKKAEQHALEKARYWLNKIDLIDKADWEAGNLPYGDQRRLEIARAMCMKPVLLCLDEPAAGLNPKESADLNTLLQDICNTEKTSLLLIEHDMSVVMNISHHIIVLEYGRRIAAGTPQEIKNNPDVIRAYLGEEAA
jgi:branched-chain amino acid transport system ATP-binding protein